MEINQLTAPQTQPRLSELKLEKCRSKSCYGFIATVIDLTAKSSSMCFIVSCLFYCYCLDKRCRHSLCDQQSQLCTISLTMPFNDRKRFDAEMHAVLLRTSAPNALARTLDDMSCQCAQHKTSVVHSTKTKNVALFSSANETNYGQLTASLSIRLYGVAGMVWRWVRTPAKLLAARRQYKTRSKADKKTHFLCSKNGEYVYAPMHSGCGNGKLWGTD